MSRPCPLFLSCDLHTSLDLHYVHTVRFPLIDGTVTCDSSPRPPGLQQEPAEEQVLCGLRPRRPARGFPHSLGSRFPGVPALGNQPGAGGCNFVTRGTFVALCSGDLGRRAHCTPRPSCHHEAGAKRGFHICHRQMQCALGPGHGVMHGLVLGRPGGEDVRAEPPSPHPGPCGHLPVVNCCAADTTWHPPFPS